MSAKIDENGKYLPFPGYTVISFLKERNNNNFASFHALMGKLKTFKKYYKALPISSFHMTIKNHICIANPDYLSYKGQMTNHVAKICEIMDVAPRCKILNMYTNSSLGVFLEIQNPENVDKLRDILVVLGMNPEPKFKFHMTFAYKYKMEIEEKDKNALDRDLRVIYKKLSSFINDSTIFEFEHARYCYFPSMEEYIQVSM